MLFRSAFDRQTQLGDELDIDSVAVDNVRGAQLVLSYPLQPQADAAAARINAYLADRTRPAFEMRESVRSVLLLRLGVPALLVGIGLGIRAWRLRRLSAPAS